MVEVSDPGPPINSEQIKAVELLLKLSLPEDYIQLLQEKNGGIISKSFHCKDGVSGYIAWLYHICEGDDDDILKCNEMRKGRLPKGFVAIGYDGGGNEICIDCTPGPRYGKIYYWDHEMEADPDQGITPETAGNVHLIADGFTQFLECLNENPNDIIPTGEITTAPEHKGRLEALMRRKGML